MSGRSKAMMKPKTKKVTKKSAMKKNGMKGKSTTKRMRNK